MKNEEVAASIAAFLKFLKDASAELEVSKREVDYCERKTQDMLHELELIESMTYHERAHLSTDLVDIRRRRRAAKDMIELLTPIVEWRNDAKLIWDKLERVLGSIRKIEDRQKNRVYWKRADDKGGFIK